MTTDAAPAAPTSRLRHLVTVARLLLGLVFLGSGLAGLLMAPPPVTSPPMSEGLVALFNGLVKSGYLLQLIKVTETAVGALLLANRFVPLALAVLAPVVVNIVAVHLVLEPSGIPVAAVVLALHLYLAWSYREFYRPMLVARARP
jgi:uncharacterized membrane protein YphA (DoxX/SURF4 family)